ncbi:flagellar hook assembly protein FlgD [Pseudomonas sp. GNP013]
MKGQLKTDNYTPSLFLEKLQERKPTAPSANKALGKDAFLQLLVKQMKNQNPLNPQDNAQFVSQLAQFSSLEGIQNLTVAVEKIAANNKSSQAMQASSLIGRSIKIDTHSTAVDTSKGITGSIIVSGTASPVTLKVYDAKLKLVNTVDLGSQKEGTANFNWNGKDAKGMHVPSGNYTFKAEGMINGKSTQYPTQFFTKVTSVTLGGNNSEPTINFAGGSVSFSKVNAIGI